jgi:hypothetical protein
MYMDAKKLINQKNYITKHKKITEMEIEEIKRNCKQVTEVTKDEREEEQLEHPGTIRNDEQKPSAVFTTQEEMGIHQHRDQIHKLRRKIESTCYQVTQIAIDNQPRLQKLQKDV